MSAIGKMLDLRIEFDQSTQVGYGQFKIKDGHWIQSSFYDSISLARKVAEKLTKRQFIRDIIIIPADCDGIHGKSAGMMLSLRFISLLLYDKDLSCERITGTGSIDENGNVLPVSYVKEKAAAAFEAGFTTFLHNNEGFDSEQGFIRVHNVQQAWAIVSACPCAGCQWKKRRGLD